MSQGSSARLVAGIAFALATTTGTLLAADGTPAQQQDSERAPCDPGAQCAFDAGVVFGGTDHGGAPWMVDGRSLAGRHLTGCDVQYPASSSALSAALRPMPINSRARQNS